MANSAMTFASQQIADIAILTVTWTADDSSADVTGTTPVMVGELIKGVTNPGTSTEQPDDDYDIALSDAAGANILTIAHDDLADRDETNSEEVVFFQRPTGGAAITVGAYPIVAGPITVAVTNAGNSNTGELILYLNGSILG